MRPARISYSEICHAKRGKNFSLAHESSRMSVLDCRSRTLQSCTPAFWLLKSLGILLPGARIEANEMQSRRLVTLEHCANVFHEQGWTSLITVDCGRFALMHSLQDAGYNRMYIPIERPCLSSPSMHSMEEHRPQRKEACRNVSAGADKVFVGTPRHRKVPNVAGLAEAIRECEDIVEVLVHDEDCSIHVEPGVAGHGAWDIVIRR